jgi:hypothetical protein
VTTGISAGDRARTVAVAIDAAKGRDDIVTPGHVFPLIARDGGVLVRAGHTEASVDISRLAGLNPSGVICEIMNEDGTMARMDDLIPFARRHGLKMGTIRDLIEYRRKHDRLVECVSEVPRSCQIMAATGGQSPIATRSTGRSASCCRRARSFPASHSGAGAHDLDLRRHAGPARPPQAHLAARHGRNRRECIGLIVLLIQPNSRAINWAEVGGTKPQTWICAPMASAPRSWRTLASMT